MGFAGEDERLLSKDERELIAKTRHPRVQELPDPELLEVARKLRELRDVTRQVGKFKRGELRGQTMAGHLEMTAGSKGTESGGHRAKRHLLTGAVKRTNKEMERRRRKIR